MSPGLLWFCYFSLVAQLASRSSGYLYSQIGLPVHLQRCAWTPISSAGRSHGRLQIPVQQQVQSAWHERQIYALGFSTVRNRASVAKAGKGTFNALPTGASIGVDSDIDGNINWDRDVDAEPHKAQTTATTTTTTTDHHASELTRTGTVALGAAVDVQKSRNVASLGITWSSPVSGLGTSSWSHPHLRSDASSLSTRSYIDSLKVADLKRACAERGLPKVSTVFNICENSNS